jgi:hypothetical protein
MPGILDGQAGALRRLAGQRTLFLTGPSGSAAAAEVGARYLEGGPIAAAEALTGLVASIS